MGLIKAPMEAYLGNLPARGSIRGVRHDPRRDASAAFVDHMTVWPSQKCGAMALSTAAGLLLKHHDRPCGRSRLNRIGARGFEPPTLCSQSNSRQFLTSVATGFPSQMLGVSNCVGFHFNTYNDLYVAPVGHQEHQSRPNLLVF